MSWHYRVRRRKFLDKWVYDIVEVYTNPKGWTDNSMAPRGDTRRGLIKDLERMLEDAKKYPTLTDREA